MIAASFALGGERSARTTLDAIRSRFGCRPEGRARRRVVYLDTIDWRLHRRGLALSLVGDGEEATLGLTTLAGEPLHRLPVEAAPQRLDDLADGPLREALAPVVKNRRLLPRLALDVQLALHAILDADGKSVARVAFESGSVRTIGVDGSEGPRRTLVSNVTVLELGGYERDARRLLRLFERELNLSALDPSPLTRALEATESEPSWVASPPRYALHPAMSAADAAREIFRVTWHTMRSNEHGVLLDIDVECVHDFRVATRRTRAALGQLKRVFADEVTEQFKREFRWLQRRTGPLRDADVFAECLPAFRERLPDDARVGIDALERQLDRRRARALKKARATLRSRRYAALRDEWSALLDEPEARAQGRRANEPVASLAARRIGRAFDRLVRKGSAIDDASPAERLHDLRIDAKKLRYLLEFFAGLYPRREIAPLVKSLKKLQEVLGDFNDLAVQQEELLGLLGEIEPGPRADAARRAVGLLVERMQVNQHALRLRFAAGFARLLAEERRVRRMLDPGEAIA